MIVQQESLEWLKNREDESVDHIITDPPYLINFMGKGWDSEDNVAGNKDYWKEALRVCKTGSYALVFGHSRTHHRVMTAMEDAGWEIRDTIMWLYGSGFPKSKNLGDGWGSALKPAYEPIIVARKPFKGSLTNNVLKNGLGGLNIDECRIAFAPKNYNPPGRFPANVILDEEAGELLGEPSRFFYCPKVSTKERNQGCEELEDKKWDKEGAAIPERKNRPFIPSKNNHPTVKPIKLMEYLVKLISKEGQTILDPFAGSGSTGIAVELLGRTFIGVEMNKEYCDIAERRLIAWKEKENKDNTFIV